MVAPAAADAAAVLPPLHGQAAAVAEIRRAAGGHFGRLGGGCGVRKGEGRQAGTIWLQAEAAVAAEAVTSLFIVSCLATVAAAADGGWACGQAASASKLAAAAAALSAPLSLACPHARDF